MTKWEPWKEFDTAPTLLPIDGPPCGLCKYWRPVRRWMEIPGVGQVFDGVQLCHAKEQQRDFSCFLDKNAIRQEE